MERYGIPADDLFEITRAFPAQMFSGSGDVHYTKEGYERIAKAVSGSIEKQLTIRCHGRRGTVERSTGYRALPPPLNGTVHD